MPAQIDCDINVQASGQVRDFFIGFEFAVYKSIKSGCQSLRHFILILASKGKGIDLKSCPIVCFKQFRRQKGNGVHTKISREITHANLLRSGASCYRSE